MSASTGGKWFCKTCNLFVSNHPSNIAKHQASDVHKNNVQAKIRQADEAKKQELAKERAAKAEIDKITKAAEEAMKHGPSTVPKSAHPLTQGYEIAYEKPQLEKTWQTCRSEDGKLYYYNRVTGQTQWTKPPELNGIGPAISRVEPSSSAPISGQVPPPRPKTSAAPPPRPKTGAAPPPRPKTAAPKPRQDTKPVEGDSKLLTSVMIEAERDTRIDPTTGFGEWEDVVADSNPDQDGSEPLIESSVPSKEDICLEMKEAARFGGRLNSSDLQVVDQRNLKTFRQDDEGEIAQFKRVITKKPRRTVDNDD